MSPSQTTALSSVTVALSGFVLIGLLLSLALSVIGKKQPLVADSKLANGELLMNRS